MLVNQPRYDKLLTKFGIRTSTWKNPVQSTATTAWELCEDVITFIEQNPKRIDMKYYRIHKLKRYMPPCGMVGCFGGLVCMLSGTVYRGNESGSMARIILGESLNYMTVNFPSETKYVFNDGYGDACEKTTPQTPEYAEAVISRIRRFMYINEVALKTNLILG